VTGKVHAVVTVGGLKRREDRERMAGGLGGRGGSAVLQHLPDTTGQETENLAATLYTAGEILVHEVLDTMEGAGVIPSQIVHDGFKDRKYVVKVVPIERSGVVLSLEFRLVAGFDNPWVFVFQIRWIYAEPHKFFLRCE
jgi:hypothetical protein